MKILQLHVDHIEYRPVKKEIPSAEDIPSLDPVREGDLLVLLVAVESGDDKSMGDTAIADVKKFADNLKVRGIMIYPFAHLSQNLALPQQALEILKHMEQAARTQRIDTFRAPFGWNKALELKIKGHPLAEMSRSYGARTEAKVVSLPKPARQLSEHELLARIKRSDFSDLPPTDHRIIGERLDLFSFQEPSPGMVYWHRNGLRLYENLKNFLRFELYKLNYQEISTPSLANTVLWEVSGHSAYYKDNMFITHLGDEEFGLKPMNCPATFLIYKTKKWSYRELPVKYSIFDPLFRNELSGVASGLFRVKVLTQDDAHIITTREKGAEAVSEIISLMERIYGVFKLPYKMKLSTRPDESMGSNEEWEEATGMLRGALETNHMDYEIKDKEGNFYAPKIDVDIKDSLGREWQCCTIQADMQMPKKFKLAYTGEDGKEHTPLVVHRTILGSLERFIGILLEHYNGKLPVWLAPVQARVISISENQAEYGRAILAQMTQAGIRAEGDFESATLGSKIKVAQLQKIPYIVIVGQSEQSSNTLSARDRTNNTEHDLAPGDFIAKVLEQNKNYE